MKIFFLVSILPGITLFQQYCFPSNFNNPSLLPSLHSHAALVEAFFPMNRLVRTTVLPSYIRYSNRVVNVVNPPTSSSALSRRDDFIDAEIIGDEGSIQRREESNDGKPKKRSKLVQDVLSLFGQDEASKKKRERNKKMNTMIDEAFEGTGLLGGGVKNIFKAVAAPLADAMAESMGDMNLIQEAVVDLLESKSDAVNYLGGDIKLGSAMQSMSSSVNIDGNLRKQMSLVMPVSGRSGSGVVQVEATVSEGRANVNKCFFQTNDGGVINVSDGSSGGYRGNNGAGTIIDAEIV